jgi:hypothetical protein
MSKFLEVHANKKDMPLVRELIAALESLAPRLSGDVKFCDAGFLLHIKRPGKSIEAPGAILESGSGEIYCYQKGKFPSASQSEGVLYRKGGVEYLGWWHYGVLTDGYKREIALPYKILGLTDRLYGLEVTPLDVFLSMYDGQELVSLREIRKGTEKHATKKRVIASSGRGGQKSSGRR